MKKLFILTITTIASQLAWSQAATIAPGTPLNIFEGKKEVVIQSSKGPITITRIMTPCAKNGGTLQPLVPVAGVTPVTESEIIEALGDKNALVVDMRDPNDRVKGTIPGSISIPYTEVAMRMDELGCKKLPDSSKQKWDCSQAKKVYGFCNGPVCPQSPSAMNAMVRDGFPANKIYYYRGGMLDWDALGLTTVKGEF
jgi:rhodanese-related sulfurtransferase